MRIVAPILPARLIAAAPGAEFSAAVADIGGAGGLLVERSAGGLSARLAGLSPPAACGPARRWR